MFQAIEKLCRYNKTMTKIILSGLSSTTMPGLQNTIAAAGRGFAENKNHQVTVLDLSYTRMSVAAVFG